MSVLPCRGLYLTAIFYKDDNILVTHEDQIPVVEIDDTYSCLLMQDFLWFTKVGSLMAPCCVLQCGSCACTLYFCPQLPPAQVLVGWWQPPH